MAVLTIGSLGSTWLARLAAMMASRSASFVDNSCFYGQIFSTAEAIQMVEHGLGVRELPNALAPLLTGPDGFTNEPVFDLPHDRIFVEVSSRKVYTLDGVHVNLQLLRKFFAGYPKLSDAVVRYWGDLEARRAYLDALADDPEIRGATDDEIWILNNISVSLLDDDQMALDFRRLHAMLGNRMVIVAGTDLRNIGVSAENRLGEFLKRISQQLSIPFVDAGKSAASAWRDVGMGSELPEGDFLRHFEYILANQLIAQFIDPAKKLIEKTVDLEDIQPLRRRRLKWKFKRPVKSSPPPVPSSSLPLHPDGALRDADLAPYQFEAGNAAWMASWQNVRTAAAAAVAAGDTTAETARLGFRAAWYSDDAEEALRIFESHLEIGAFAPAELLEGVELAFQLGRPDDALRWAVMAVQDAPAIAEPAFRLAMLYGFEDRTLELLETAAGGGEPVVELIQLLSRDSNVKRRLAYDMLNRWSGELIRPNAESLLILALRGYDPGSDVDRARNIYRWCHNLAAATYAKTFASRALIKALNAALNIVDQQSAPDEAESIATELAELEPSNARALLYLAQRREDQGRMDEAAELLHLLAGYHPERVVIQRNCANQWLKAGNFLKAHAVLRKAEEKHKNNPSLFQMRTKLDEAIEKHLLAVSASEREEFKLAYDMADEIPVPQAPVGQDE